MAYSTWKDDALRADVQTTDATITTLATFTPPADGMSLVDLRVLALLADKSKGKVWKLAGAIRFTAGVGSVLGALSTMVNDGDPGTGPWSVTIDAIGGLIRLRVQGQVGDAIDWTLMARAYIAS